MKLSQRLYTASAVLILLVLYCCPSSQARTIVHVNPGNVAVAAAVLEHAHDSMTVRFSAGTYFFNRPIAVADGVDLLTLEPEPGAKVTLSAGQLIGGWKPATLNGHACFSTSLVAVQLGLWNFRELWVNGTRATRCRFPATGYIASVEPKDDGVPWNQGQTWFGYKPGDLPDDLPKEAEAIVMNRWEDSRLPIDTVDPATHRVNSVRKTVFHLEDGDPYFLEGAAQWFGHPGDWYLDRSAGILYYLPRAGETIKKLVAIAPTRDRILQLDHASNVTIRDLTFSHSEWNFHEQLMGDDPETGGFGQAEIGVSSAVVFTHCHDCRIASCRFEHLGNYALELGQGCQQDAVDRCQFTDMGAGAIKIGETDLRDSVDDQAFGNKVTNCRIIDGGHMLPSACGIWIGQSCDNLIAHNELADLYYTAISVGWTWGYGPSLAKNNRIEANLVHDIGKKSNGDGPILSDMGALYMLGARAGTVVTGNVFHDIAGRVYGGWGIYLDEGSSDVLIEKNLVYRTTHGGFHVNYGQNNHVHNNIFAFGRDLQIARTRTEQGLSFSFNNNIVYWDTGVFTATDAAALSFDNNLYRCFGQGKLLFGGQSLDQWKAAGQDVHSILADPGFSDPAHGDFTFLPDPDSGNSAAKKIGFEQFDLSDAGPAGR